MRKLIIRFYVLYILVITYFSLIPIGGKVSTSIEDKVSTSIMHKVSTSIGGKITTSIWHKVSTSIGDKVSHFIAYLILFIIAKKVHTKSNYLTCVIICCIYSFSIECIQRFIPTRGFEGLDIIVNLLGIFLGVLIYKSFIEKYFEITSNYKVCPENI